MPTKKTTPQKAAPKKTATVKAVPAKAAPKKASPKKVAPKKVTPRPEPVETIIPAVELIEETAAPEEIVVPAPEPVESVEPLPPAAPVEPVPPAPVQAIALPVPPQVVSPGSDKPGMVKTIGVMTLINGILNVLYGLGMTAGIVLGTFFIGVICAPLTILPVILGTFEIIYAVKLLANPPQVVKPSQAIAIFEIVAILTGNIVSAIVGILALIFYADASVKAYFARLNHQI